MIRRRASISTSTDWLRKLSGTFNTTNLIHCTQQHPPPSAEAASERARHYHNHGFTTSKRPQHSRTARNKRTPSHNVNTSSSSALNPTTRANPNKPSLIPPRRWNLQTPPRCPSHPPRPLQPRHPILPRARPSPTPRLRVPLLLRHLERFTPPKRRRLHKRRHERSGRQKGRRRRWRRGRCGW